MSIVKWSDDFNINVVEVDTQHRTILELVNKIHSSVESQIDKTILKDLLLELVEYTDMHFSTEEKLMKEYDFPGYVAHQKEHKVLLHHLDNLLKVVSNGKYPTFYSDYDISSDWAIIHIIECDKQLGSFLNSKNVY